MRARESARGQLLPWSLQWNALHSTETGERCRVRQRAEGCRIALERVAAGPHLGDSETMTHPSCPEQTGRALQTSPINISCLINVHVSEL